MNILVTGAEGFVGTKLVEELIKTKHRLFICVGEKTKKKYVKKVSIVYEGNLMFSAFDSLTKKMDLIIHCAGLAHNRNSKKFESKYFTINTELTNRLARSAIKNNVKKFIFLSTAGIHSDQRSKGINITEEKYINPQNPYTKSKLKAEISLKNICKSSKMDFVILRPPAVYGDNVKGNLKHLLFFIKNKILYYFFKVL